MPTFTGGAVTLTVDGTSYFFTKRSLEGFPEAHGFLTALIARGRVSAANAVYYVKLVARFRRQGRLNTPKALIQRVEKTAANAYWRWCGENYAVRVRPVLDVLKNAEARAGIRWLRRGSLVPPLPGKMLLRRLLPVPTKPGEAPQPQRTIAEEPCSVWTLHVPRRASMPVHTDPCPDCEIVKLTLEQVEVIAAAFENAWGHRNLEAVPADCFLFGTPPIASEVTMQVAPSERVVAVVPESALAHALDQIGASVSRESLAFIDRVREASTAAVTIDFRSLKPDQIDPVLMAVREAAFRWHDAHPPEVVAPPMPLPTNNLPLPGVPMTVYDTPLVDTTTEYGAPVQPVEMQTQAPSTLAGFAAVILGETPPPSPLDTPPTPAPVDPGTQFTDWAAINAAVRTRLVHCTLHKEPHSVTADAVPCAQGAWVDIPQ